MTNNTKSKAKRNSLLLVLTAVIWGVAFVAQREGGDATGPYTFCFLRYVIGGAVLIPVIKLFDKTGVSKYRPETKKEKRLLIKGGVSAGVCLGIASLFQQVGIYLGTSAGKAGFLTACYIVLVPILGLFLKRRCGINAWAAVAITVAGLYLLCINGEFTMEKSDILVLICSLVYAMQILTIDRFISQNVDGVRMSSIMSFTAAVISAVPMFFVELNGSFAELPEAMSAAFSREALIPILYTGIMSSGVAYTLQIIGQKDVNPTVASLIMSLESVFSFIAGWIILGERMNVRELIGCGLIFAAVVLAQIPIDKIKNKKAVQG